MSCIVSILNSLKAAFMKRALCLFFFFSFGFTNFGVSAAVGQAVSSDSHKPVLDRLESITTLPISDFRFHSDMAHPEDPSLDDSNWERVKVGEKWSNGSRVLRRSVEIPAKLNGYSTQGARVKLELNFESWSPLVITVFSNGGMIYHGDDLSQQALPLTVSAQPGQTFVIAVRLDEQALETHISTCRLLFEPPRDRPNPALFREEILAAQSVIAAYAEGRADRQQQLDAAVKAVDLAALDRGDQSGFDESLRQAQAKLQVLDPWLKQFTIRIVGNSHIDMAWLWPWTETVEVVRNTFRSVLDLLREYPDFKFTMSSARTYEWMEEKYPDLFKEIEQRVKHGR
ncbi:MAG: hypothetical protein DMG81_18990, partial [Acidobacteria bacterium]